MHVMIIVVAFQFILCLAVKCTGVSIVWCAILAWVVMIMLGLRRRSMITIRNWNDYSGDGKQQSTIEETTSLHHRDKVIKNNNPSLDQSNTSSSFNVASLDPTLYHHQQQQHAKLVIGLNILVLLFYAINMKIITTIAHVCAILLGLVLWKIICCVKMR